MNVSDIDLDISSLTDGIPEDNVVFYFRGGDGEAPDMILAKGNLMQMGEVLAAIMEQNPQLEQMVAHACLCRE